MLNMNNRINRSTYIVKVLLGISVLIGVVLVLYIIDTVVYPQFSDTLIKILLISAIVAVKLYDFCILRQRCNDISSNRALILTLLFYFTPLYIIAFVWPGEKRQSRYGEIPQGINLK